MAQKWPKMAQNYPKWPTNDAPIYALYPQFFLTEKAIPQTFSFLECMIWTPPNKLQYALFWSQSFLFWQKLYRWQSFIHNLTQDEGEEASEILEVGDHGDRDRSGSLATSSASLPSQPPTPKLGAVGGKRAKAEPAKIRPARRCRQNYN